MKTRISYLDYIATVELPPLPAERIVQWCIQTSTYLYRGLGSDSEAKHEAHVNGYRRVCIHRA